MTRLNVVHALRFDSGIKVGFSDTLWYENKKFIRQRVAGNGIGERVEISGREALRLIKQNF